MRLLFYITIILLAITFSRSKGYKLVCDYDTLSPSRLGPAQFTPKDMELALNYCTHIIYSYVTIKPKKFTLSALSIERERELAAMKSFKAKFPNVKFLLSLSGENNWKTTKMFLNLLEADKLTRKHFIKSLMKVVIKYKFDGLSLDLILPIEKPKTHESFFDKCWLKFKHLFKNTSEQDAKVREHKAQLTTLIQQLRTSMQVWGGLLILNALPNVNADKYFDIPEISNNLDFIILSAFDFYTPQFTPNEANMMAPIKQNEMTGESWPLANAKSLYKYWHSLALPRHKIVIGIAAFGRAWKMTKKSNSDGIPPVLNTDGPAAAGPYTMTRGFLSWAEICAKLSNDNHLTTVTDPKAKSGVYSFRPADIRNNFGIWISYEDPHTAATKATYVRNHNLGGVALFEISLDDVRGECSGERFSILKSIKFSLTKVED